MNAFRGQRIPLYNSLVFELTNDREVAATDCVLGAVGLEVAHSAVVRSFKGDVWSEPQEDGILKPTRHASKANGNHTEYFCKPNYVAIVINKSRATSQEQSAAVRIANNFNLKIRYMRE